jgi:dTDP-4-amino-4,6-dideoxygalactose transaminase
MIANVAAVSFSKFCDEVRGGSLTFGQYGDQIPFDVKRFFFIDNVPAHGKRGAHAHQFVKQCLICVRGSIQVLVDNGTDKQTIVLDSSSQGLVLQEMVWSEQTYLEPESSLLVLASETYDEGEYLRDYTVFSSMAAQMRAPQLAAPTGHVKVTQGGFADKSKENRGTNAHALPVISSLDLRPSKDMLQDMVDACTDVIQSGHFVLGPQVVAFEADWAAYCEARHAVGVGSGLDAVLLMLKAANLPPGGGVIVPANTYIATIMGVKLAGLTPVLVEPDAATHNVDPALVAASVCSTTVAILAVDLYGQPAQVGELRRIAADNGLKLFCDAAQSHGAKVCGRKAASLYDACAFSFYPSKNLGAVGEAGAVVTGDAVLADRVRMLRNYGSRTRYFNEELGINSRLDTIQAAMLRRKLMSLDADNMRRAQLAACYVRELESVAWLQLPTVFDDVEPVWHQFVVRCTARDALQRHLAAHGVQTLIHYPVPPHLSQCMRDMNARAGDFPVTEQLAGTVLSLPIGPHLSVGDVVTVCECVKSFK